MKIYFPQNLTESFSRDVLANPVNLMGLKYLKNQDKKKNGIQYFHKAALLIHLQHRMTLCHTARHIKVITTSV